KIDERQLRFGAALQPGVLELAGRGKEVVEDAAPFDWVIGIRRVESGGDRQRIGQLGRLEDALLPFEEDAASAGREMLQFRSRYSNPSLPQLADVVNCFETDARLVEHRVILLPSTEDALPERLLLVGRGLRFRGHGALRPGPVERFQRVRTSHLRSDALRI